MRSNGIAHPYPAHGPWIARRGADRVDARLVQKTLLFLLLHLPLGFAVKSSPVLATAHALVTLAGGLLLIGGARSLGQVLPVFGYAVVSESLWRVGNAMVFYEMAKYVLAAFALVAWLRFHRRVPLVKTPAIYFFLLLPSILAMPEFDREDISFNLSGPFALALATFLLSRLSISPLVLRKTLTALTGPIVALAAVATFSTVTTEEIYFYASKIASGGLGQNQASSLFGLGSLIAFLYLSLLRRHNVLYWVFGCVGLWCAAQAVLTFSRGGIATALGAAAAVAFYLSRDRRFRGAVVVRVILVALVASLFLIPVLDSFTGGALTDRFTSATLTGRDKIIRADLMAFRENPLFGLGPGQSYKFHARTFRASSSHTEYSRLLAEHGIFGLSALLLLLVMSWRWVHQQPDVKGKALSAALVTWALLYMFHAAMRMAVVSFLFALASTYLVESRPPPQPPSYPHGHRLRQRPRR